VGAPISTYYQVLQLMTDKENPAHVEVAKKALEPFNLFVVALYHPERHWELGRVMERDFSMLDDRTGEEMLFFAPVQPPAGWMAMVHRKRSYSKLIDALWKEGVGLNSEPPNTGDIDSAFRSFASELQVPETMLPCLIVTPDMTKERIFLYKTCPEHVVTQLMYLSQIARDHSEIKHDWGTGTRVLAQMRNRVDLCGGSTARDLGRPLAEGLKTVTALLYYSMAQFKEGLDALNTKLDDLRATEKKLNESEERPDATRYGFYKEPRTWTIIFDGTPIGNLTSIGFLYIHFLVSRPREKFTVRDLGKLTNEPEIIHVDPTKEASEEDESDAKKYPRRKNGEGSDDRDYLHRLEIHLATIEDQIQGAGAYDGPDFDREKLESDKEKIQQEINMLKSRIRYGKDQDEENSENAKLKNRIAKRIERAVKDLEKAYPKAGAHFEQALRPINSYIQCYNPSEDIRWHFK
jgi:hypothetical protein